MEKDLNKTDTSGVVGYTKFTETPPEAPVLQSTDSTTPAPSAVVEVPAIEVPAATVTEGSGEIGVAAPTPAPAPSHLALHQEVEVIAEDLWKKLKVLGIDFEVFLRSAFQRHNAD